MYGRSIYGTDIYGGVFYNQTENINAVASVFPTPTARFSLVNGLSGTATASLFVSTYYRFTTTLAGQTSVTNLPTVRIPRSSSLTGQGLIDSSYIVVMGQPTLFAGSGFITVDDDVRFGIAETVNGVGSLSAFRPIVAINPLNNQLTGYGNISVSYSYLRFTPSYANLDPDRFIYVPYRIAIVAIEKPETRSVTIEAPPSRVVEITR